MKSKKEIIEIKSIGNQIVYNTNVKDNRNYISSNNIIHKNCVIDYDYEGEIHFDMHNIGLEDQTLNAGDKIIQFILTKIDPCDLVEVEDAEVLYAGTKSERGEGGFGSTGTR